MASMRIKIKIVIVAVSLVLVQPSATFEAPFNPSTPTATTSTSSRSKNPSIGQVNPSGMVYKGAPAPASDDLLGDGPNKTIDSSDNFLKTVGKLIHEIGYWKAVDILVILLSIVAIVVCANKKN